MTQDMLYQCLLQNPFVGICITDEQGKCLMVNDAQTRITGIPKKDFINQDMHALVADNRLSLSSTLEVLKTRKEVNLHQVTSAGKAYDVKGVPVFDGEGRIRFVVSYLLDVTEIEKFKGMVGRLEKDKQAAEDEIKRLLGTQEQAGGILYYGKRMQQVVATTKKVADSDAAVLITGSSGTGKELIANLIHTYSSRSRKPFIKVNCAAIPQSLLESELFGYEPGAFTGGNPKGSKGIFELADGGSLLLDEIGDMPLPLQAKLLRVLQDQEVWRIGGDQPIKVDVRIISSTNSSLKKKIAEHKFREDLYYRLNVILIEVPDLAERREDIPILIAHFLKQFNAKYREEKTFSLEALQYLISMEYPGNVRELKNLIERLIVQSTETEITIHDVFEICSNVQVRQGEDMSGVDIYASQENSLKDMIAAYEKAVLKEFMTVYQSADIVAKKLKVDRSTISRKLNKYDL